jgi:hypothetical protein
MKHQPGQAHIQWDAGIYWSNGAVNPAGNVGLLTWLMRVY